MRRNLLSGFTIATIALVQPAAAQVGGRGGPPVQGAEPDLPVLEQFDRDRNKVLDRTERDAARAYLAAHPELRPPPRAVRITRTGTPGARLTDADVKIYPSTVPLYDAGTLRTFFIEFEHPDWEQEL